jgi:hypothetical protein
MFGIRQIWYQTGLVSDRPGTRKVWYLIGTAMLLMLKVKTEK